MIDAARAISTASHLTPVQRQARAESASKDFEAMFATQMLAPMWETVPVNEETGGGHGEEVFRTMLLQEYGKVVAANGSLGIAAKVKQEMLKQQEVQP